MKNNAMTLADQYSIKARFQRSTRLDSDFTDPNIFDSFVLHDTASGVVQSIGKQFAESGQKSFTITGPYGGGKSTLAVLLSALYSPVEGIRTAAEKLVKNKKDLNQLRKHLPLGKKGWVTIRLVGSKSDLLTAFVEAIEVALTEYWPTRKPDAVSNLKQIKDEKSLLQFLLAMSKEANVHGGGLLERANSYGDAIYTKLVKTISLLDLFGRAFAIKPDKALLSAIFQQVSSKELDTALSQLEKNSIVVFRKHLDSWAIFAGSDIDLDAEVSVLKDKLAGNVTSWEMISQKLRPVVAKRYYHETGSLRWFERKIEYFANIKSLHSVNGPVHFVLALGQGSDSSENDILAASKASGHIVGSSPSASLILPMALELAALEEAGRSLPGLAGDKVARRELGGRIDLVRNKLNRVIEEAFDTAQWYFKGKLYSAGNANLSQIASKVAEKIYPKTPTIKNELINRDKPSSNAVAARRTLLYKMVTDGGKDKLGIVGSPPELSLYLNLLSATGIHRADDSISG